MALLNTPKAFEKALLESSVAQDVGPFIDYVNQNFDQIIRAFFNQISFPENFRGVRKTITALNNQAVTLDLGDVRPLGIIILSSSVGINSYFFTQNSQGFTEITFNFREPRYIKTKSCDASASPLVTFEVLDSEELLPGDSVIVSGFGAKENNTQYLVVTRSAKTFLTLSFAAVTETKSAFTGNSETSKTVDLFIFF